MLFLQIISFQKLALAVCKETGLITSVTMLGGEKIPLNQEFYWYNGNGKNCSITDKGASGVYAFNPLIDSAFRMVIETKNFIVYKGINIMSWIVKNSLEIYIYKANQ